MESHSSLFRITRESGETVQEAVQDLLQRSSIPHSNRQESLCLIVKNGRQLTSEGGHGFTDGIANSISGA
jgi:hypothetical protein